MKECDFHYTFTLSLCKLNLIWEELHVNDELNNNEEFDFEDLFDGEEDEIAIDPNLPHVKVLVPGREAIYVVTTAEGITAADALYQAGFTVRPGVDQVFVDGTQAGMQTVVLPGSTITPVGAVKGG